MGIVLLIACCVIFWFGQSSIQEAFKRRYLGFGVAGAGQIGLAATAAVTESWWWLLGAVVWLFLSPLLIPIAFGQPPLVPGPMSYIDDSGRRFRLVADPETGAVAQVYEDESAPPPTN